MAPPAPEPQRFGKYQILERIALGGMAEIFKARLDGIGGFHRTFAIKRILPNLTQNAEFVDMLVDEAKVAGLLSHANIVQILDLGAIDSQYYIAMEYVNGRDLGVLLHRCEDKGITFPVPHAVYVLLEMLKGLEYAHNRQVPKNGRSQPLNIVHRDISPGNVLISFQGEVKLTDFGIAKASVRALETLSGVFKGRYDYSSPEQAFQDEVDQRSDLFSAGVVFYQLLTGTHPFRQPNDLATLEAVKRGDFVLPSRVNPDVPPILDRVVQRALQVDADERFPNATVFREALDAFFRDSGFIFSASMLASFVRGLFPELELRPGERPVENGVDARPSRPPPPPPSPRQEAPSRPPAANLLPPPPARIGLAGAPGGAQATTEPPVDLGPPDRPRAPSSAADRALLDSAVLHRNLPQAQSVDYETDAGLSEEATLIRPAGPGDVASWTEAATVIRPGDASLHQVETQIGTQEPTRPGLGGRPSPVKTLAGARIRSPEPPPPPRLPTAERPALPFPTPETSWRTPAFVHVAYALVGLIALVFGVLAGIALERTGVAPGEPIVVRLDPVLEIHFPVGAAVTVDGRAVPGGSPATLKVQANRPAVVKVTGAGYAETSTQVTLDYNQMRVVSFSPVEITTSGAP